VATLTHIAVEVLEETLKMVVGDQTALIVDTVLGTITVWYILDIL
jgi:hypothetical protein